jgi:uncharacterized membrane protein
MIADLSPHTGARLAEVAFLLIALAGVALWVRASGRGRRESTAFVGLALAAAGVLLIVATHWGHFGAG